ncbi:MAG: ABC transporter substrate-binding protein [Bacillota bacterium]|nr:ABC transporter substrate-binding protein [Bacillota bacterium]
MAGAKIYIAIIIVLTMLFPTGCGSSKKVSGNELLITFGLMPAVDSAPFLLADEKGYFKEQGLDVTLKMFSNPQDRQSALQTHSIDGAITDFIAVCVNVENGFDIKATTMTNGMFPLLIKKGSEDKKIIKAGMMELSVTNFLLDEWLDSSYTVDKIYIDEIPARLAAVSSGRLDMGVFPEPVASMGELEGLEKKIYDLEDGYCPDTAVFTGKALKDKEEAVGLFLKAYNKAVDDISKNRQEARDILMEKIPNLKPEIRDKIVLPEYTRTLLPDDKYIDKIIKWTSGILKKELKVKAEDLVERKFLK